MRVKFEDGQLFWLKSAFEKMKKKLFIEQTLPRRFNTA